MNQPTPEPSTPAGDTPNRRCLRVPFSRDRIPVTLLGEHGERIDIEVTGRNLSQSGVGVLIEYNVQRGARCEIEMQTLSGRISQHGGVVVFSRPVRGELHEIGIAFDDVIDLEQYVALQRAHRMIYQKEKQANQEKVQRIHAHAQAATLAQGGTSTSAPPAPPPPARLIVSHLAQQPGKEQELQAYLDELAQRTGKLAAATEQADRQAMLDLTQWVIDTAQPHGFPTLFAVANVVLTYIEDEEEDLETVRGQVNELLGYLRRARPAG